MSGIKITLEIGHTCGDQNPNGFLLLSFKHENMESLDGANCLAPFLTKIS